MMMGVPLRGDFKTAEMRCDKNDAAAARVRVVNQRAPINVEHQCGSLGLRAKPDGRQLSEALAGLAHRRAQQRRIVITSLMKMRTHAAAHPARQAIREPAEADTDGVQDTQRQVRRQYEQGFEQGGEVAKSVTGPDKISGFSAPFINSHRHPP